MDQLWAHLIGASPAIRTVQEEIGYAARSMAKVLLTGESGVGKEVVARLIHAQSARAAEPFVTVTCAGLPDSVLESELFGHGGAPASVGRERTGHLELAHGGTIFLDEVGEMSLRMQALLLRFLETSEIQRATAEPSIPKLDVRVIAATSRKLVERIGEKAFREDLYYRLNVIHIAIAPLRERREDIVPLLRHFLAEYARRQGIATPELTPEASALVTSYHWPGNVRELTSVAERLTLRARGAAIDEASLPAEIHGVRLAPPVAAAGVSAPSRADSLFDRMMEGGSFWSVVYAPFMARDLTRDDLRRIVTRGLRRTRGSYKMLVQIFNMPPRDYKRFLNFLRKHECHMPFQPFRAIGAPREPQRGSPST